MALMAADYHIQSDVTLLGQTLPSLLRAAVDADPDAVAAADGQRAWTWQQWWEAAEALARGLQERGLAAHDVVVAQVPNSWDFLVLHAAVAIAGAVLLPVHSGNSPRDLTSLARRGKARMVVVTAAQATSGLTELGADILIAGDAPGGSPAHPTVGDVVKEFTGARPRGVRVCPNDPFLLVPSSATTSTRPKIAMHSHDGLLSNAAAVVGAGDFRRDDVLVSASPFSHLFGLLSLHASLFARTTQLLLPAWDVDRFISLARTSVGPVVLFAVPAQLRDLLGRLPDRHEHPIHLREVRTGGSHVPASLVEGLRRYYQASVVVQWGMSELGAGLFTNADDQPEVAAESVGRPVPGARVRITRDGDDCRPGEIGELWVRSPYAFRGYLGDVELTNRALSDACWLRTGDLASIERHGLVVFHGRMAELIDVGGQKFAATEVEELLADLPGLGPAAVFGRADTRLGEYPCLAVTPNSSVTLRDIAAHLRAKGVAPHKIPIELVTLPAIPLTATGKIARGQLRDTMADRAGEMVDPGEHRPGQAKAAETADSLLDTVTAHTCAVLTELTGRSAPPAIGHHDTFRDHGLTSLGAVRLAHTLGEAIGLALASNVTFDHPTPSELAQHLAGLLHADRADHAPVVPTTGPFAQPHGPDDPLVVVGMSCRLPGGIDSPDDLWQLLIDERDAIGSVPPKRGWAADVGANPAQHPRAGGYLEDMARFDAAFFGIRPAEADAMDPQQRLVLEATWHAVENAGIDPVSLRGSNTGVFVGMFASDYAPRVTEAVDCYDGNLLIGNASSVASGRVAYVLGLHGPAVTVDTACSSSLVALHQAASAIRVGDCDRAIVAGATIMSTPATFVDFGQHGLLAADGRCKPFAADADGVGWAEGVAALVVEPLSTARRDGHRVLAVLRGSAVNSDGTSNGLSAPNGTAQRAVITLALANAGLTADDVQAIEAHGTGTPLGDLVEARALCDVFGARRTPGVWVGSVKSNLGHTQAAAGLVGVIKMILALQHGLLPRTLHVDTPNTQVDWSDDTVRLLEHAMPWPAGTRRAGISAFGMSGTNVHAIIEEPPRIRPRRPRLAESPAPWVLSAASPDALRAWAGRMHALANDKRDRPHPDDIAHALVKGRSSLGCRAVALPDDTGDHTPALAALAMGDYHDDAVTGRRHDGRTAFVFAGQGPQWEGMATDLVHTSRPFAEAFDACDLALRPHLGWSVRQMALGAVADPPADRADAIQAMLFATMVALAALWRSVGVHPDAVTGHSLGEVVAAHVAGALTLDDAARIVAARGRVARQMSGRGAMAAVTLSADAMGEYLRGSGGDLSIAAVNGPCSVVISGDPQQLREATVELRNRGVSARSIAVDWASHSPQVEPLLSLLRDQLADIAPLPGRVPFVSSVTGREIDTRTLTVEHWCRNIRDQVNLFQAIQILAELGCRRFIEISAHPVLTGAIEQTAPESSAVIETLRRGQGNLRRFHRSLAQAYVHGVDWSSLLPSAGEPVDLPAYPFQRREHWLRGVPGARPAAPAAVPTLRAAPTNPRHLVPLVRQQVAALLGHGDPGLIDVDRAFPDLGFHSLAAAELRNRIAAVTGISVPVTLVFHHPTVRSLAHALISRAAGADIDFHAEAQLADDIVPAAAFRRPGDPRHILLTGATGFLGAFLLRDLVRETSAVVHCLVRGADEEDCRTRLRANLEFYRVDVDLNRISIVRGDLSEPRLGLTEERFDALATEIDCVYHVGSVVNWLQPYRNLAAANVSGTEEILRLAARHRTVPVHYISTVGVFAKAAAVALRPTDPTGPPEALTSGYRQSKWVAETMIGTARRRGLPVAVYRVDVVCGDLANGACQTRDFVWLAVKGMAQARAVPRELAGAFHLVPVDHVSRVITAVSLHSADGTFHLHNQTAVSFADIARTMRASGYVLDELDATEWTNRVRADRENALNPLLDDFEAITAPGGALPQLDTSATLAMSGIECPAVTPELLGKHLSFFVEAGFLPGPHDD